MVQSVKWPTLNFGTGLDLGVLGPSPTLGFMFSEESVGDALSPSPCPSLILSQINKYFFKMRS